MKDARLGKPAVCEALEALPRHAMSLTPTPERPQPDPFDRLSKGFHEPPIGRHSIVTDSVSRLQTEVSHRAATDIISRRQSSDGWTGLCGQSAGAYGLRGWTANTSHCLLCKQLTPLVMRASKAILLDIFMRFLLSWSQEHADVVLDQPMKGTKIWQRSPIPSSSSEALTTSP